MEAPAVPAPVAVDPARLLVDQVVAIQRTLPVTVAGTLLLGAVVVWALHGLVPAIGLAVWGALLVLHCAANVWVIAVTRHRPVSLRNARRRARAGVRSAFMLGCIWAVGILALWPAADGALPQKLLLVFLVAGVSSGALHSLSTHLPTFTAFFVPTVAAVAGAALREGGEVFLAVAGVAAVYGLVTWRYAYTLNRTLLDAMRRRHEMAALASRLEAEAQHVRQARRARSLLLAAASHDLRQPVHALSLTLGVGASGPMQAAQSQWLSLAQRSVQALAVQLDALLDLGRLDAGELRAEPRSVPLRPLVERIVEAMRPEAAARGLALRMRAAEATVYTDPLLAERMVRNLLTNAIRYTDQGGIVVALRACPTGGARVDVVDTGIGIPLHAQAGVFDELVQVDPAAGRGGFGLGLAIVRGCAQLLGHELLLRSVPGRGSHFTVCFQAPPPRAASLAGVAETALPDEAASPDGTARPALDGAVVVLVEDDAAVRAATAALLAQWGAEVIAEADVERALGRLVARPVRPALVIADGRLSAGPGGVAAVQRVREEYNADNLPALVISADSAALAEAQAAGLIALRKPVTPAALEAATRQALAGRAAGALQAAA